MINKFIQTVFICIGIVLFSFAGDAKKITLSNPSSIERTDELVILKRETLEEILGKIPAGYYVQIFAAGNRPVVVQFDDFNKDNIWDEAVFLYSYKPNESISFTVSSSQKKAAIKAVVKAHVRHRRKNPDETFGPDLAKDSIPAGQSATDFNVQLLPPFLTEGPVWENDKVGFRLYFDVRNAKDIWGKTTSAMVLDTVGQNPKADYHHIAPWGMDILKVGASLGAGALALSIPLTAEKDTLIRLGGKEMGKVIYEKITDGPVRATFRLLYPEWKVLNAPLPVQLTEEISIWGGQYYYESKIIIKNAPEKAKLVTGIVNLKSKSASKIELKNTNILYTYDEQSENHDRLGMGIIVAGNQFEKLGQTSNESGNIRNTYTVQLNIQQSNPSVFRFYSGWEKSDPRFSSEKSFNDFMLSEAEKFGHPVELKK